MKTQDGDADSLTDLPLKENGGRIVRRRVVHHAVETSRPFPHMLHKPFEASGGLPWFSPCDKRDDPYSKAPARQASTGNFARGIGDLVEGTPCKEVRVRSSARGNNLYAGIQGIARMNKDQKSCRIKVFRGGYLSVLTAAQRAN